MSKAKIVDKDWKEIPNAMFVFWREGYKINFSTADEGGLRVLVTHSDSEPNAPQFFPDLNSAIDWVDEQARKRGT